MLSDAEHLHRWTVDRAIIGDGRKLAYALDAKVKDLEEQLAIVMEQCDVACDRAQSWKNLAETYKELADARGEALALRDRRGKCGMKNHHESCDCQGEGGDR